MRSLAPVFRAAFAALKTGANSIHVMLHSHAMIPVANCMAIGILFKHVKMNARGFRHVISLEINICA